MSFFFAGMTAPMRLSWQKCQALARRILVRQQHPQPQGQPPAPEMEPEPCEQVRRNGCRRISSRMSWKPISTYSLLAVRGNGV
jgi:hypothetical protein